MLKTKNARWDKEDGVLVGRKCYNSYFYPVEDQSINPLDKIILHGEEVIQYLDGRSALHLNLEETPNRDGFVKLLNAAAHSGSNYFCFNVKITICNDCSHIDKQTLAQCPSCQSKNVDHATRVIGYLKRVSNFSTDRQKEHRLRFYHLEEEQSENLNKHRARIINNAQERKTIHQLN